MNVSVPASVGYTAFLANIGKVRNTGVEFNIKSVNITNRDFTKNARIAAKKNNVKLWNRYVLDSLIDTAQKNQKKNNLMM